MKKTCCYPACPNLIDKGAYCPAHQASRPKRHTIYNKQVRERDPALAEAYRIRCSSGWKQVRRQFLSDYPICSDPFGEHERAGITRTATQVHHIVGLIERPDLWNSRDNLQALCTSCHARIERAVRRNQSESIQSPPEPSSQQWCPFG